jgi:hypothetical protein
MSTLLGPLERIGVSLPTARVVMYMYKADNAGCYITTFNRHSYISSNFVAYFLPQFVQHKPTLTVPALDLP